MKLRDFTRATSTARAVTKESLPAVLGSDYRYFEDRATASGHYWRVSLACFPDDDLNLYSRILYFDSPESALRRRSDVSGFFRDNEQLFDRVWLGANDDSFEWLEPVFGEFYTDDSASPFLDIEAVYLARDDDHFSAELLSEDICLIEGSENSGIGVSNMMSQRQWIFVPGADRLTRMLVPYDKAILFPGARKSDYRGQDLGELEQPPPVDENYIFVIMSFAQDPSLEDAYNAIVRVVNDWRPLAEVERIDLVPEDFKISERILASIDRAGLVVADLTGERPNVYFELSFSRARRKAVIQMAREGSNLHFDVRDMNTILYRNITELEGKLRVRLQKLGGEGGVGAQPGADAATA